MNTRGQGRVFLRSGSPFWYIAYYAHGKEQRETACHVRTGEKLDATDKNRREAERFLKQRLGELAAERHGGRTFVGPQAKRVTVNEILDALESDFRLRDKWNAKTASVVKPLRERFGTWHAVDLSTENIGAYMETLRGEEYSNASVNRRLQILGQAFKVAIRNKRLSQQPFIPRLSERDNVRQGFLSESETEAVIANLPEDLRDFVRWSALCGMRKGEGASLTWDMVHGDELHVPGDVCKNRKARVLPLVGELAKIVERRRQAARVEVDGTVRMVPFIFHRDGGPVGEFRKSWATACVAAGVGVMVCPHCKASGAAHVCSTCEVETRYSGKIFHDLRRVACRRMVRAGVNPQVARKWSGHETDSMFTRYAILTTDDMREAFQTTEKFREVEKRKVVAIAKE